VGITVCASAGAVVGFSVFAAVGDSVLTILASDIGTETGSSSGSSESSSGDVKKSGGIAGAVLGIEIVSGLPGAVESPFI